MFKKCENGFILKVKISPNASRNEILAGDGIIRVKVTAPAVDNKANKALIKLLSKHLKIPKTSIEIIKGEKTGEKTLLIKAESLNTTLSADNHPGLSGYLIE